MNSKSLPERNALTAKWGSALDAGFQVVPNVLLRAQSRLELDSVDVVILLNLNLHWWEKDSLPYPPPALIAKRMGVSRRTVERRISRLQKAGWLTRLPAYATGGEFRSRKYDLSGLVARLQDAAAISLIQRNYRATHQRVKGPRASRPDTRQKRLMGGG